MIFIFLYACGSWTLNKDLERACGSWTFNKDLERRISAFEMKCYRKLLNISYKDRIRNYHIREVLTNAIGRHDELLTIVRKRKLKWFGHVI